MPKDLNIIERATLARRLRRNYERIAKLELLLSGLPVGTAHFNDLAVTSAKILNLSASKLEGGIISVGEDILVNDGTTNRILINRDTIRVSKEGTEVTATITNANKKDFILLETEDADKILIAEMVSATSYTHDLGYIPWFLAFEADSASNPTEFTPLENSPYGGPVATTTQIQGLTNPTFLLIFHRDT